MVTIFVAGMLEYIVEVESISRIKNIRAVPKIASSWSPEQGVGIKVQTLSPFPLT